MLRNKERHDNYRQKGLADRRLIMNSWKIDQCQADHELHIVSSNKNMVAISEQKGWTPQWQTVCAFPVSTCSCLAAFLWEGGCVGQFAHLSR